MRRLAIKYLTLGLGVALLLGIAGYLSRPGDAPGDGTCPASDVVRATTPAAQTADFAVRLHLRQQREREQGHHAFVVFGDSIAQRWPTAVLRERLGLAGVLNLGVGGDTVANALGRLADTAPLPDARTIVVVLGTNDLRDGLAPCAVAEGLRHNIRELRERAPQATIVLAEVLPRGIAFSGRLATRHQLNGLIRAMAGEMGLVLLPVPEKLTCFSPLPALCGTYELDALHLTPAGYHVLSDALAAVLDERPLGGP